MSRMPGRFLMEKHLVTRIVRDSVLDGPGCRYVVFVKGCNLRCKWCHNPETQVPLQEIMFYSQFCIKCGKCSKLYLFPENDMPVQERLKGEIDSSCFTCVYSCPANALEFAAQEYASIEIFQDMMKYKTIYKNTGGGLTISGGEPLLAPEFSFDLLTKAKAGGFHTIVDTNGTLDWEIMEKFLPVVDLWLYDFKHPDDESVCSKINISNMARLIELDADIWIRIPVIPGYNDSEQILVKMAQVVSNMAKKDIKVFLLPFQPLAESKYQALGKEYFFAGVKPDDLGIELARSIFSNCLSHESIYTGRAFVQ